GPTASTPSTKLAASWNQGDRRAVRVWPCATLRRAFCSARWSFSASRCRSGCNALIRVCRPERSEAQSRDPAELSFGFATGLKAWPRGLGPLRCSLDFARNDETLRCGEQSPAD